MSFRPHHFLVLACLWLSPVRGQVTSAGTLYVDVDFRLLPEGQIGSVPNPGAAGGHFALPGQNAAATPRVATLGGAGGRRALVLDGADFLHHLSGANGPLQNAPSGLTGLNATHTIEAWVLNATVGTDSEWVAGWGTFTGDNQEATLAYSSNNGRGAVSHSSAADVPWFASGGGAPSTGAWHHLVYTFDGTTSRVYADGALRNSEVTGAGVINPLATRPIILGAQNLATTGVNVNLASSLAIGRLRIHDGVLSPTAVTNNFNAERLSYSLGTGRPLLRRPKHRYRFNNPAGSATGATITDSEGGAHGIVRGANATFLTGSHLRLPGGSPETQAYVDLPNFLISTNGAANGGSGEITFEGWVTPRNTLAYSRFFDFGSCTLGEVTGPGPGTNFSAQDHVTAMAVLSAETNRRQVSIANNDPVGGGISGVQDTSYHSHSLNIPLHFAVTWDERTGRVRVYENGLLVTDMLSNKNLSNLNDINNWLGRANSYTGHLNIQADYDEFRIYDRALAPAEIYGNFQQGPEVVNLLTPGTLVSLDLRVPFTTFFPDARHELSVVGDYDNLAGVDLTDSVATLLSSSDSNVVVVTTNRQLRAMGLGTAVITAQNGARGDTVAVQVVPDSATLEHRYSFDSGVTDSVGSAHGVLNGSAQVTGGSLVLDRFSSDYATLPPGLTTGDYAISVECWADFGALANWARLFDFGEINPAFQGRRYLHFAPHTPTGGAQLALSNQDPGYEDEHLVTLPHQLDNRVNQHVVAVFHPRARKMRLFVNGVLEAENTNVTARLEDVADVRCFLGRSLYSADPYFTGSIHEFRIHDGVLTPQRVALGLAAGPDALPPADPGAVTAVHLAGPATLNLNQPGQVRLTGDFTGVSGVPLEPFGPVLYSSSNTNVLRVAADGRLTAIAPGTAILTGAFDTFLDTLSVTVGRVAPLTLAHRYSFSGDCTDSIGGAHGSLSNQTGQAHYAAGQLVLGNTGAQTPEADNGDYVNLPNYLVSALYPDATFEVWTTWQGPATSAWQRILDFGNSDRGEDLSSLNPSSGGAFDQYYLMMSPHGEGAEPLTFLYRGSSSAYESRRLNHTAPLPTGVKKHLVAVIDGSSTQAFFYVDGVLAETKPLHLQLNWISDLNNWLGRSQYNDPLYVGSYDEFRLYKGSFGPGDVALSFQAGPNPGPGQWFNQPLVIRSSTNDTLRLSWSADQGDSVLQYADELAWGFFDAWWATPVLEAGEWVVHDTPPSLYRYYRLRRGP